MKNIFFANLIDFFRERFIAKPWKTNVIKWKSDGTLKSELDILNEKYDYKKMRSMYYDILKNCADPPILPDFLNQCFITLFNKFNNQMHLFEKNVLNNNIIKINNTIENTLNTIMSTSASEGDYYEKLYQNEPNETEEDYEVILITESDSEENEKEKDTIKNEGYTSEGDDLKIEIGGFNEMYGAGMFDVNFIEDNEPEKVSEPVEETPEPVEEEVSEPVEETPEPVEEVSEPIEEVSEPVEKVSKPIEEVSEQQGGMSEVVEEVSEPVEDVSEPVEEVSESIKEVSEPVEEKLEQQVGIHILNDLQEGGKTSVAEDILSNEEENVEDPEEKFKNEMYDSDTYNKEQKRKKDKHKSKTSSSSEYSVDLEYSGEESSNEYDYVDIDEIDNHLNIKRLYNKFMKEVYMDSGNITLGSDEYDELLKLREDELIDKLKLYDEFLEFRKFQQMKKEKMNYISQVKYMDEQEEKYMEEPEENFGGFNKTKSTIDTSTKPTIDTSTKPTIDTSTKPTIDTSTKPIINTPSKQQEKTSTKQQETPSKQQEKTTTKQQEKIKKKKWIGIEH